MTLSSSKVVIVYTHSPSPYDGTVIEGTVSGTSISFDPVFVFESGNTFIISYRHMTLLMVK